MFVDVTALQRITSLFSLFGLIVTIKLLLTPPAGNMSELSTVKDDAELLILDLKTVLEITSFVFLIRHPVDTFIFKSFFMYDPYNEELLKIFQSLPVLSSLKVSLGLEEPPMGRLLS